MVSGTGCRDPNRDLHGTEYDKSGALRVSLETALVLVVISKKTSRLAQPLYVANSVTIYLVFFSHKGIAIKGAILAS